MNVLKIKHYLNFNLIFQKCQIKPQNLFFVNPKLHPFLNESLIDFNGQFAVTVQMNQGYR